MENVEMPKQVFESFLDLEKDLIARIGDLQKKNSDLEKELILLKNDLKTIEFRAQEHNKTLIIKNDLLSRENQLLKSQLSEPANS